MADLNTIGGLHYEMMRRCYNEKSVAYKNYGAKGIKVCEEWHDRETFRKWCKENGWEKGLRINRIDAKKDYDPNNCIFGTFSSYKNGIAKKAKSLKIYRKQMKESFGVPERYSNTRLYKIYVGMHSRCEYPTSTHYELYGGRGISVCDEWSGKYGFFYFYKWSMENGYNKKLSIDRIDNDKGYSPDNCRWATMSEQINNRRVSRKVLYNGEMCRISDIAKEAGVSYNTIYNLVIYKRFSADEAIKLIKESAV